MSLELQLGANVQPAVDALKQVSTGLKSMGEEVKRTDQTWQQFVGQRMGSYMQQFGSHGAAIKQIAEEWKAYKGNIEQAVPANEHIKASFAGETGIIQQLRAQLAGLKTSLQNATDPADIAKFSSAIVNTKNQLHDALAGSNAFATSTFGVSRATRLAHADLENVSQSIRGFATGSERGIDALSNIVFSFERLKGVAGGAGAAFRSIGQTLLGPAGIVLAITTLIPLAQGFIDKLFGTSDAEKEAAKDAEELTKKIKELTEATDKIAAGVTGGFAGEIAQVKDLAAIVQNQTKSYRERNQALSELKTINKDYFGDLTLESSKLVELKSKVEEYTKALVAQGLVKAFVEDISKVGKELAIQELALNKIKGPLDKFKTGIDETGAPIITLRDQSGSAAKVIGDLSDAFEKQQAIIKPLREQYNNLDEALKLAIEDAANHPLKLKTDDATKGLTEVQRKLIALADLAQEFFNIPLKLKFSVDDTDKEKLQKAIEIIKGIKDQTIRLRVVVPDDITIPKLKPEIDKEEFKKSIDDLLIKNSVPLNIALQTPSFLEQLDDLKRKLNEAFKIDPKNITESLKNIFVQSDKEIEETLKLAIKFDIKPDELVRETNRIKTFLPTHLQQKLDIEIKAGHIQAVGVLQGIAKMNEDIQQALSEGLKKAIEESSVAVGEAIGTALAGGDLGKALKSFIASIGGVMEQVGRAMISAAIKIKLATEAFKKFLLANPGAAIAIGIALVALGKALSQSVANTKGFAQGGRPEVGKLAIVGERGPEFFVPDQPGRIIPNNQIKSFADNNFSNISSAVNQNSFSKAIQSANSVNNFSSTVINSLPHLQAGGITTSDTIAQLHKAEVIMPLDRLQGLIGNGGSNGYDLHSTEKITVEGENIALALDRYFKRKGRSY